MKKLLIFLSLIIGLYSCSDMEQSSPATLTITLEDSPVDYQEFMVKIDRVLLFNGTQWYELDFAKVSLDILKLTGGEYFILLDQSIPAGEYTQLKFVFLPEGNYVKVNDQTHQLTISEADREVVMPIKLNFGSKSEYLMCDIDAATSVNENGWVFKPSLKVIDINESGAISGILSTKDGKSINQRMLVKVESADGVSRYTYTNIGNGKLFIRVDQGVYTVSVIPNATSTYATTIISDVVVNRAEATKLPPVVMLIKQINE